MHHVQGDLVLRPGLRAGWARLGVGVVTGVVTTAGIAFRVGPGAALATGVAWTVLVAAVALHLHRARIVLTAHEIVLKGAFFQRRRSRSRAVWTIRATVVQPRGGPCDTLFVLDQHGGVLVRVYGANYTTEDMDRLVSALGLPCSGPEGPVTPKELDRFRPGLVTWAEQHAYLLGMAFAVALTLAIVAGVLIGLALTEG
ncbi:MULTISPECIES: hypothetical protein [Nocardiopsis]|uniref:PH domain-containing protein n=1 Tax=Nocardiopsis dassonvillei (strain ATCC 23218 / DSM 43111 / CIP 107115 / JCM 7437 / KCTC 9190 / NBRC 14626 / NCTC 10488 / NRRL B-5397 / IMRU 509) TaxID=446468 RepID=D7AUZ2_NOCDD|nr:MULTISPECIES: hypothetical protein [Nocardiopsis]ADH69542.1 conserved hypothetical protein [Nocardiopsis dassonvillei subsp. dassonvillei DSM 43111]APC37545.1 hypothetical protein A9R04_23995 [Nocardiopsis dassonvillei]NKY79059.1 hypothetical protein [Nocardiopsis dassonvillei]VEI90052.1 Uncharacterised protein [Nocardiopsis dassonvillei]